MASVNRPTNVKQRDADIDQKLRLYGIFTGMCDCIDALLSELECSPMLVALLTIEP